MPKPELLLVYEPEAACRSRLAADRFPPDRAQEISSYLAQSTDLAPEFPLIEAECAQRGIGFTPVELDHLAAALDTRDPRHTLVWTLTDGIAYYRGSVAPALARLKGFRTIGADDSVFALCQDKFRAGAVLSALGLPAPSAGLARNGVWIVEPPKSTSGYFVKPNRLGSKIGIWPDSKCKTADEALALSRRIFEHYRDDAIVQPYVAGRNVRASFLALKSEAGAEMLGAYFVDAGGDFQTMADSLALYGETGEAAKASGSYAEPVLIDLANTRRDAMANIHDVAGRLIAGVGLRDVFSVDLRLEDDGTLHLIEFEVCPGLPCFDFRAYLSAKWRLTLAEAMAATAASRLES
jgi:D-alanine-D-alanine ligase